MSAGAKYPASTRPAGGLVRPTRMRPCRGLPCGILLATMLVAAAGPGAALAQSCTGPCLPDRLFLAVNAPAADQQNSTGTSADREGSLPAWRLPKRGSSGSTPRWTVSVEAIGLGRVGGVDQTLVARVPGNVQFSDTASASGVEALNANQFQGSSAGPRLSLVYHGESGIGAELTYFNVFNQGATKAIGPDSPADWLVMKPPGAFWQTQDFPDQAIVWKSTTSLFSAEANARLDLSGRVTALAGFRWFQLNDKLQGYMSPADRTAPTWKQTCSPNCTIFDITAGNTPAGNYPPFWVTSTTNNLYGVQIGADVKLLELGRFSLGGLIKAGIFDNRAEQWTGVSMRKTVYPSQAAADHAAFASELGLQLKYQVADALAVKVGYKALWFAGVALAPGQIEATATTPSSVTALTVNCGSHALFQGVTAGLEYSF